MTCPLIAVVIGEGPITIYGSLALIVATLLLMVSPTASHALGRAAYKGSRPMWEGAERDEPRESKSGRRSG